MEGRGLPSRWADGVGRLGLDSAAQGSLVLSTLVGRKPCLGAVFCAARASCVVAINEFLRCTHVLQLALRRGRPCRMRPCPQA